jgi:hypothetical protein
MPLIQNPYATERHFLSEVLFIEIEFSDDNGLHRVWPYIGSTGFVNYKGQQFFSENKQKYPLSGSFETQAAAREAALAEGQRLIDEACDDLYEQERVRISPELDEWDMRNGLDGLRF